MIINLRGAGGSGKTELARRILAEYGWVRGGPDEQPSTVELIRRDGRSRPFGYRLQHPHGKRPLAALGDYGRTSGGCDTISIADGGLGEALGRAREYAEAAHDVLIEGLRLSTEVELTAELARTSRLHVIVLDTSVEECARNLAARRRLPVRTTAMLAERASAEEEEIRAAADRLRAAVHVESYPFDAAHERVRELLGFT